MISAYDSRKNRKKNRPKSLIYRYLSDISTTISKGTHMSNKHECRWIFFCILSIYRSLSLIYQVKYRRYIGEDPRVDIIGHVEG